jgi:hypothetical protein
MAQLRFPHEKELRIIEMSQLFACVAVHGRFFLEPLGDKSLCCRKWAHHNEE